MSYRVRELPAAEWSRLADIPDLKDKPIPTPETARAVVAERNGEIVGVWFAQFQVHIEPVWISAAHRCGVLPKRMFKQLNQLLDSCSITSAFCFSDRPEIAGYLRRLGLTETPYQTFKLR